MARTSSLRPMLASGGRRSSCFRLGLMRALVIIAVVANLAGCATRPVPSGTDMVPTIPAWFSARSILAFAPAPEYPMIARRQRLQGDGVVLMVIDRHTGQV